ncbi:MAG: flagellar motor protein MotB [Pseudoprimorskyibacter sp.]|nr:flagellar motor protein MotB [Pseudoprimorskyibacter sp.]
MNGENTPIIIKRKKIVAGQSHHGGAWKVAYADFVTAMMAFFMLMWLLNATTEKQRKGIADYFSPTIAVNRVSGGGDGNFGGSSVFSENTLPKVGTGASSIHPTESAQARGALSAKSDSLDEAKELVELLDEILLGSGGESILEENEMRHVDLRVTDRGVVVEFFALPRSPLFDAVDQPTQLMESLVRAVAVAARGIPNSMAVETHTAAVPVVVAENPVWNSSTRQAEEIRRLAIQNGVETDRIERTTAHADRSLIVSNPMSVRNNRVEIVFLRK